MARKYRSLPLMALVLCLGISPASGQTPAPAPAPPVLAIDGPATVSVYSLGSYAVTGDPLAKVAWLIVPSTSQVSSGQHFTMTGQPGKYLVIAFAVSGGQPVILEQVVTISGTAPTPTPDPVPSPPPIPAPAPAPAPSTTGPYLVAFVTDAKAVTVMSAAQVALQSSTTMGGSLKAMAFGNQWMPRADINNSVITPYASEIRRRASLPCVAIIGTDANGRGAVVEAIANPADESSVLAEIRRLAFGGVPR